MKENIRMHKLPPNVAKANFFPYEKEKQTLNVLCDITCPLPPTPIE